MRIGGPRGDPEPADPADLAGGGEISPGGADPSRRAAEGRREAVVASIGAQRSAARKRMPGDPGDMPDPELPANAVGGRYASYRGALFVDGIDPLDVGQGDLGDCYLMAALGAVARTDPGLLQRLIRENGDGTYTVTFKERTRRGVRDVPITVDPDLPRGRGGPLFGRGLGGGAQGRELWPSIVEKAYAVWKGGYEAIDDGGWADEAMTAITGHRSTSFFCADLSEPEIAERIFAALREGHPVCAGTDKGRRSVEAGLLPLHYYTVLDVVERRGTTLVRLRDPQGVAEPADDGRADGVFDLPIEDVRACFEDVAINHA